MIANEIDVLRTVSERLDKNGFAYMLTGSFALSYYAMPRMTRDLDLVIDLAETRIDALVEHFEQDFYLDIESVRSAVRDERPFKLMHLDNGIKVDFIIRKSTEYRRLEFTRRRRVISDGLSTVVASREDLILSKLVWARDAESELQLRDVQSLLDVNAGEIMDRDYLRKWAAELGVLELLTAVESRNPSAA